MPLLNPIVEPLETRLLLSSTSGALDPTFGHGGNASIPVVGSASVFDAAIMDGGKLLAAGNVADYSGTGGSRFALARFNANGTPDVSFGNNGIVLGPENYQSNASIERILIDPSGKIIVGGESNDDFALARYNANGTPDNTFGDGGMVVTDLGGYETLSGLAIQGNKIIATGSSDNSIALARYDSHGVLDTSFGHGGSTITAATGDSAMLDGKGGAAILPDGRILIVGNHTDDNGSSIALAYYRPNGGLDTIKLGPSQDAPTAVTAFALLPGGQVLTLGNNSDYAFSLERHNADGTLDTAFGDGGSVTDLIDSGTGLSVQNNGKIVVSGMAQANGGASVARFNRNGSVDESFGVNGRVGTSAVEEPGPVLVQADGKIVMVGSAFRL